MALHLQQECERLAQKSRFLSAVTNGKLKVANRTKADLLNELHQLQFKTENDIAGITNNNSNATTIANSTDNSTTGYDYLLNIPLWNLTKEKIDRLNKEKEEKDQELKRLQQVTVHDVWRKELVQLKKEIELEYFHSSSSSSASTNTTTNSPPKAKKKVISGK